MVRLEEEFSGTERGKPEPSVCLLLSAGSGVGPISAGSSFFLLGNWEKHKHLLGRW